MRLRGAFVTVATVTLILGPGFAHGVLTSAAGAAKECTIRGSAADDSLTGTTRADVICTKAGQDEAGGRGGNDVLRMGQGDDGFSTGDDGQDVVKGQADDDDVCGNDGNDRIFGGQGADDLGGSSAAGCYYGWNNDADTDEGGDDFLKSQDNVSGNDFVDGGENTDECTVDAADFVYNCEE
jgi:Ca2+-binding RTX toxin-like protein